MILLTGKKKYWQRHRKSQVNIAYVQVNKTKGTKKMKLERG